MEPLISKEPISQSTSESTNQESTINQGLKILKKKKTKVSFVIDLKVKKNKIKASEKKKKNISFSLVKKRKYLKLPKKTHPISEGLKESWLKLTIDQRLHYPLPYQPLKTLNSL